MKKTESAQGSPPEPPERARLLAEVARQRVRLAKDELKRARKRLKEAKREARRARKHAALARKAWKRLSGRDRAAVAATSARGPVAPRRPPSVHKAARRRKKASARNGKTA
ncbi:MAG: hypothetical protein JSR67_02470 [Proteobacteria bacterium]|nr:hypothetical protein [Pseudomonadota bacterium]